MTLETTKLFKDLTTQDSKKYQKVDSYEVAITNYKDALSCIDIVLMNNAPSLDEDLIMELYETEQRYWYENNEIKEVDGVDVDEDGYEFEMSEPYQYLVTDASEYTMNKLEERHGITSVYSEKLGVYVIPVYHYGTSWNYIGVPDNDFNANDVLELRKQEV